MRSPRVTLLLLTFPSLIGAVGGSVTFCSNDTDTKGDGAFWTFGNIPIVTVPFEDPPRPVFSEEKYKTRFAVSEGGRALSVSQLRMEDAGTYSVKIGGKISTFTLRVYNNLPEPTVTCETQNCSGGICSFSLRCSVTGAGFGNVSYTWTGRGHLWGEESFELPVNKSQQEEPDPLTCTARNAVSSRNVTVTAPDWAGMLRLGWADPAPLRSRWDLGMRFGVGIWGSGFGDGIWGSGFGAGIIGVPREALTPVPVLSPRQKTPRTLAAPVSCHPCPRPDVSPKCPQMSPSVPKCPEMSPSVLECPQMSPSDPKCPQMSPSVLKCPRQLFHVWPGRGIGILGIWGFWGFGDSGIL
uniref:Ig-like domain-containing protein n=1 Tax=Cyanoderma ruficeps TaxID=181631 RepID=A0A8C3QVV5_9PASS